MNPEDIERTTGDFPTSLIGASLGSKEGKIGVLCSYNCKPGKKFSNDDEDVLEFFSRFASVEISKKEVINADQGLSTLESWRDISQSMLSDEELPVSQSGIISTTTLPGQQQNPWKNIEMKPLNFTKIFGKILLK